MREIVKKNLNSKMIIFSLHVVRLMLCNMLVVTYLIKEYLLLAFSVYDLDIDNDEDKIIID